MEESGFLPVFDRSVRRAGIDRLLRKVLGPYFIILLVIIGIGAWNQIGFHEGFNIGDWLINYQGGFVRRGFAGEILYLLARLTSLSPAVLLVSFQIAIFSVYFFFSYKILQKKSDLVKYMTLIFSPFLFTFAINSQAGGYRKEIIYFAVLAVTVYAHQFYDPQKFKRLVFWILFLYPMVILTDELGLVILPLLAAIFWDKIHPADSRTRIVLALLLLENASAFCLVILNHQVSANQVNKIIDSLIQTGYDPKGSGGAIGALHSSTLANMIDTFGSIINAKYYLYYPFALLLCSIAYIPLRKNIERAFRNQSLVIGYAGSMVILIPVFIIANDWGRWSYILLVELFMMILIVDDEKTNIPEIERMEYGPVSIFTRSVLLASYALFWYLPHVLENGSSWHNLFHNLPFTN